MISIAEGPLLLVFAAVVRRGSFSAAAKELRLSKSVVSERVKRLEEHCGARLLERTTRTVQLTELGAQVLAAATTVQDALKHLSHTLDAAKSEPVGKLRVATTHDLGPLLVAPAVARLTRAYPKVFVEIVSDDAQRDVLDQQIDVAVRLGAAKSSSLVLRKLATLDEPIVAAPSLAEKLHKCLRPRDLADQPWVRHSVVSPQTLKFVGPNGSSEELVPRWSAEANSGATVLALLLNGVGVGVFPSHAVSEHLRAGRLIRLCPGWLWKTLSLYAVTASRPSQRPAVQAMLAMLQEQIAFDHRRWSKTL